MIAKSFLPAVLALASLASSDMGHKISRNPFRHHDGDPRKTARPDDKMRRNRQHNARKKQRGKKK